MTMFFCFFILCFDALLMDLEKKTSLEFCCMPWDCHYYYLRLGPP
jgi:hypothetical protein